MDGIISFVMTTNSLFFMADPLLYSSFLARATYLVTQYRSTLPQWTKWTGQHDTAITLADL